MPSVKLDDRQKEAYDAVLGGRNVFITGVAGTGKSTILNEVKSKKEMAITATTGIAAVNIGGQTLHSYFGIGLAREPADQLINFMSSKAKKRIRRTKTLVIDEVSMLSKALFEKLEEIARKVRHTEEYFGGIQIVFFGDFLQLPPVAKGASEPDFCFESVKWQEANFKTVLLTHVYRQEKRRFVDILRQVREGTLDDEGEAILQKCVYEKGKHPEDITPVVLYSTNAEAKRRNSEKLAEIQEKPRQYTAIRSGDPRKAENLIKATRAEELLLLKTGAQVMMMINQNQDVGVVNGSTGIVRGFYEGNPRVYFYDADIELVIPPYKWEAVEFDPNTLEKHTVASVQQVPLLLAWAITIHKSQGMTIPFLFCDFARVFTDSQIYVALSRARDLDGLFLQNFSRDKITVNEKCLNFYANL
jgi:ATP-dependent DNA helicase PIF1